ncbi:MAG: SIS domain-containing protein [Gammaproteobacteria bacterium]
MALTATETSEKNITHPLIAQALSVIEIETQALKNLSQSLDHHFIKACELILNCKGRVVVLGLGKSGHIARKITATLASTGTPSCFVHPTEGLHGDLGMITKQDVALCLSNSGETEEILQVLHRIKRLGIPTIAFTKPQSNLAQYSDAVLNTSVEKEACPLGLAPTSSTTVMLAMGDALAISLLKARGFSAEDFAETHPGGQLGRQSRFSKVKNIMRSGEKMPQVTEEASIAQALAEISAKALGMTTVVSKTNSKRLLGVFTDGDLRRSLEKGYDINKTLVTQAMTDPCMTIQENHLSIEAVRLMEEHRITALAVLDDQNNLVGAFNLHDLFAQELL